MDQRPMDGAEPLAPPNAETAQAYLEELERVRSRREERIDRRALGLMALANAIVLAVYVTIATFAIGVAQANMSFLVLLALFMLWIQLSTEYRERQGAPGSPLSDSRRVNYGFVVVLLVVVFSGFVVSALGVDLPAIVRFIPGVVVLLIVGIPAVRDLRGSSRVDSGVVRRPLVPAERWVTIGTGVIIAASIWVIGAGSPLLTPYFAMVVMICYLGWWIAGRVSERLPAIGAVWALPHWLVFALAGAAVAAVIVAQLLGFAASVAALAPYGAVVIVLLFIGSAFVDGRDG